MRTSTDHGTARRFQHILRPILVVGCAVAGLTLGAVTAADTPAVRRPGDPLVTAMPISAADRSETRARVGAIARRLGIPGRAAAPRRTYRALDLRVVDETEVTDRRGRTVAVIRTDGASRALRSVVRLDWTVDADRSRVDRSSADSHARRHARLAGLTPPEVPAEVRWDDAMGAWRVDWGRRIDGFPAPGDGLTVWVHRGGQLAALRRAESGTAAAPFERIGPDDAATAALGWAVRHGVPATGLTLAVAPDLVWVRPNDFLVGGGAADTDPLLRLAYRVDLAMPSSGSSPHHLAIFVDAGSGALIAGVETA